MFFAYFLTALDPLLTMIKSFVFLTFSLPSASLDLKVPYMSGTRVHTNIFVIGMNVILKTFRACLHGVGEPGLVGLVSFVFTLCGTQDKRNLPH